MIVFLRHAESYNNFKENEFYTESALLTDKGTMQAYRLARELKYYFDLIIVSPSIRTISTVYPILTKNQTKHLEKADIGEFNYINIGLCTKSYRNQLKLTFWMNYDSDFKINNKSESFNDLIDRAIRFIDELKAKSERTILVCSHKYFLISIKWALLHVNNDSYLRDKKLFYEFCQEWALKPAEFHTIEEISSEKY